MTCGCYNVEFVREPSDATFGITMERTCELVVDLVAFSAADGHYLTKEGYTILVKI